MQPAFPAFPYGQPLPAAPPGFAGPAFAASPGFAFPGVIPGASPQVQASVPAGQALAGARQLAASQGVQSMMFSIVPEAFLPASLPASITTKLEAGACVDFDEAFRALKMGPASSADSKDSASASDSKHSASNKKVMFLRDWLSVFAPITLWVADNKPDKLRDHVSYLKGFNLLATRSGFPAAYDYDRLNRDYCSRSGAPLALFKNDLWLPPAAFSDDREPALSSSRKRAKESTPTASVSGKKVRVTRYHGDVEVCYKFNHFSCTEPCPSKRAHVCWSCSKEHSSLNCKAGSSASKGKR